MAFDPDKYLARSTAAPAAPAPFDPDTWLASRTPDVSEFNPDAFLQARNIIPLPDPATGGPVTPEMMRPYDDTGIVDVQMADTPPEAERLAKPMEQWTEEERTAYMQRQGSALKTDTFGKVVMGGFSNSMVGQLANSMDKALGGQDVSFLDVARYARLHGLDASDTRTGRFLTETLPSLLADSPAYLAASAAVPAYVLFPALDVASQAMDMHTQDADYDPHSTAKAAIFGAALRFVPRVSGRSGGATRRVGQEMGDLTVKAAVATGAGTGYDVVQQLVQDGKVDVDPADVAEHFLTSLAMFTVFHAPKLYAAGKSGAIESRLKSYGLKPEHARDLTNIARHNAETPAGVRKVMDAVLSDKTKSKAFAEFIIRNGYSKAPVSASGTPRPSPDQAVMDDLLRKTADRLAHRAKALGEYTAPARPGLPPPSGQPAMMRTIVPPPPTGPTLSSPQRPLITPLPAAQVAPSRGNQPAPVAPSARESAAAARIEKLATVARAAIQNADGSDMNHGHLRSLDQSELRSLMDELGKGSYTDPIGVALDAENIDSQWVFNELDYYFREAAKPAAQVAPSPGNQPAPSVQPVETVPAPASNAGNVAPESAPRGGQPATWQAVTPQGEVEIAGNWKVVDLGALVTSDNQAYDQSLQPRNRDTAPSRDQIASIALNPDTRRLADSPMSDTGAPIVEANNQVLSGNGRVMGLRQAYESGKADKYRAFVQEQAKALGLSTEGMQSPVLVREITDASGRSLQEVAELSNRSAILQRGEAELAEADAKLLRTTEIMDLWAPDAVGTITAASNRSFLREFVRATGEQGLINSDGSFSQAIGGRVQRAVLGALIGNDPASRTVLREAIEKREELGIQRQLDGLMISGGNLLKLGKAKPDYDITPYLSEAFKDFISFRRAMMNGEVKSISDYTRQVDMFAEARRPETELLLNELASRNTIKATREFLDEYARLAGKVDTTTGDMFVQSATSAGDLLRRASHAGQETRSEQTDLFAGASQTDRGKPTQRAVSPPAQSSQAGPPEVGPDARMNAGPADRLFTGSANTNPGPAPASYPVWATMKPETADGLRLTRAIASDKKGRRYGVRAVAEFLNNAIGIEARRMRSQVSRKHPAHYKPFSHVVATGAMPTQVMFHEAGHGLKELIEARNPAFWSLYADQLLALTKLPGSMASANNTHEGVAEWLRRLVIDPASVESLPMTGPVLQALNQTIPEMGAAMRDAARAYRAHVSRDVDAQWRSFSRDEGHYRPNLAGLWQWMTGTVSDKMYSMTQKGVARGHPVNRLDHAVFKHIMRTRGDVDMTYGKALEKARQVRARYTTPLRDAYQNVLRIKAEVNHALKGHSASKGVRFIGPDGNFVKVTDYTFEDIVKGVGKDNWETFVNGGYALTALDRFAKKNLQYPGQLDGITPQHLQDMTRAAMKSVPNFMEHYKKVEDFFNALLRVKDAGGLKAEGEVDRMMDAYEFYWPMPRIGERSVAGGTGHANITAGDHRARGSWEGIRDLLEVAEERTTKAYTAYYWNELGNRIASNMQSIAEDRNLPFEVRKEAARVMIPLKMPVRVAATTNPNEIANWIAEWMNQNPHMRPPQYGPNDVVKPDDISVIGGFKELWRSAPPNEIQVVRLTQNGEPKYFQVGDPVLFHMFSSTEQPGTVMKALSSMIGPTTANWKREKTQNITFAAWSLVRDSFTGVLFGDTYAQMIPGANIARGIWERFARKYPQIRQDGELLSRNLQTEHNLAARMKNSAAWNWFMEGMVDYRHPNPYIRAVANAINPHNILNAMIFKPADFINTITLGRYLSPFQEETEREGAAAFAKDKGMTDEAAARRYWTSAGNFAEQPGLADLRTAGRLPGFWNPMVQGVYQTWDRMSDPDPARRIAFMGRLGWIGAMFGGAALVNYEFMDEDDKRRERERSIQDRMGYASTKGLRTPFPYGLEGVAASLAYNTTLDYFLDNKVSNREKHDMRRILSKRLFDPGSAMGMTLGPLGFSALEAKMNRSWFFDSHIVSPWMENLPPAMQARANTPEYYKKLGQWLDYSPQKIEYVMRSGLSFQLDNTIKLIERWNKGTPIEENADIPFVGRMFVRDPIGFRSRSVRTLEEMSQQVSQMNRLLDEKGYRDLHDLRVHPTQNLPADVAAIQMQVLQVRALTQGMSYIQRMSELSNWMDRSSQSQILGDMAGPEMRMVSRDIQAQMVFAAQSLLAAHPNAEQFVEDIYKSIQQLDLPEPVTELYNLYNQFKRVN
jgi:hypothetical protein